MDAKSGDKAGGLPIWIAVAFFSSVLLIVLVFSEPAHSALCEISFESGANCLRDFLSEFQTLITGLAAVIAASATIYLMKKTDAAQEARHRELVQLTLRSDRLAVERALVPQALELQRIQLALDIEISRVTSRQDSELFWAGAAQLAGSVSRALTLCEHTIDRQAFVDGSRLFGGYLAATIHGFRIQLEPRRKRCHDAIGQLNFRRSDVDGPAWSDFEVSSRALKVVRDASEISNELATIIEGFRGLSREYHLQVDFARYP